MIEDDALAIQDIDASGKVDADVLRRAHNMCVHVLLGGEGGLVTRSDLGSVISVTSVKVHFDGFSHSSGHQRGYVR